MKWSIYPLNILCLANEAWRKAVAQCLATGPTESTFGDIALKVVQLYCDFIPYFYAGPLLKLFWQRISYIMKTPSGYGGA
jgi:hypothetical protein